jgi:hypothetical protein
MEWELYDLSTDWTQSENLAAKNPAKLKQLQDMFWLEAKKYKLPLDASVATRLVAPRPSITAGRNVFTFAGEFTGTPNGVATSVLNASYTFKAEVEVPQGDFRSQLIRIENHDNVPAIAEVRVRDTSGYVRLQLRGLGTGWKSVRFRRLSLRDRCGRFDS